MNDAPRRNLTSSSFDGQKHGQLTLLSFSHKDSKSKPIWNVICECGKKKQVRISSILNGLIQSCGIGHSRPRTHGKSETQGYNAWLSMRTRCQNPNSHAYDRYGGRGIVVCERWEDYANFLADMGERPSSRHSLDRIDNNGPYSPENCRWATPEEQGRNKRTNRILELNGRSMCLQDWARELGLNHSSLLERLQKWPIEKALTTPCLKQH